MSEKYRWRQITKKNAVSYWPNMCVALLEHCVPNIISKQKKLDVAPLKHLKYMASKRKCI